MVGFLLIPFTYFYGEERDVDIYDIDYIPVTFSEKICNSLKYTVNFLLYNTLTCQNKLFFVGFITVLLITGLVYRPGQSNGMQKGKEVEWIKKLFDVDHVGESAISFGMGVFTAIGAVFWIIYGGYGIGALPIDLLRGEKSLEQTKNEV